MGRNAESVNLPVTGMPLPMRFRPSRPLTDDELYLFSATNEVAWIEREANGEISIKPISPTIVGAVSADVSCDLAQWLEREGRRGELLLGAGFFLPDGSMLGPRLALLSPEKWAVIVNREKDGFAPFAPDFVVEFDGPFDETGEMARKMGRWAANGVQLGWLIDPFEKIITIYRPGAEPEEYVNPSSLQGTGPIAGFELVLQRVWG
ncbi:MAG TPA: Uma2 family endonuclease [Acidobacteriaceae bacterium]|nr:Uma2 family endonuclease [Acidobacteriaceae bacterium]